MTSRPVSYILQITFLLFAFIDCGENAVTFEVPEACKFTGEDSYFVGFNEVRVVLKGHLLAYEPNIDCTFHIKDTAGTAGVNLTWERFDMEPPDGSGSCQDYVQLFKVDPVTNTVVSLTDQRCGSIPPADRVETVRDVIVHVKTTSSPSRHTGFALHYTRLSRPGRSHSNSKAINVADSGLKAVVGVGVFLVITILVMLVVLLWCIFNHQRHLRRITKNEKLRKSGKLWRRIDTKAELYLREHNPPPSELALKQPLPLMMPPPGWASDRAPPVVWDSNTHWT